MDKYKESPQQQTLPLLKSLPINCLKDRTCSVIARTLVIGSLVAGAMVPAASALNSLREPPTQEEVLAKALALLPPDWSLEDHQSLLEINKACTQVISGPFSGIDPEVMNHCTRIYEKMQGELTRRTTNGSPELMGP